MFSSIISDGAVIGVRTNTKYARIHKKQAKGKKKHHVTTDGVVVIPMT